MLKSIAKFTYTKAAPVILHTPPDWSKPKPPAYMVFSGYLNALQPPSMRLNYSRITIASADPAPPRTGMGCPPRPFGWRGAAPPGEYEASGTGLVESLWRVGARRE